MIWNNGTVEFHVRQKLYHQQECCQCGVSLTPASLAVPRATLIDPEVSLDSVVSMETPPSLFFSFLLTLSKGTSCLCLSLETRK